MRLLPDKPAKLANGNLGFSYEDYADAIAKLVDSAPRPFTLGIFGKWGSGKSTIIKYLGENLDIEKYAFVKFDVWKYEQDALRRSFLVAIAQQLNKVDGLLKHKIKPKELEEKLYKSTSTSEEKFKLSWITLIIALLLGVLIFVLTNKHLTKPGAALLGLLPVIIIGLQQLQPTMFIRKISFAQDPAGSPEEFEEIFRGFLRNIKNKCLVVVIDNLDRTQKDKSVELLSTIKTFLNSDDGDEDVVFIIACDDNAIKEHIQSVYKTDGHSEFDANEFLRKFFNASVDLPVLIPSEVTQFIANALNEVGIKRFEGNSELQLIINFGYGDNPREIKQFINNLTSSYGVLTIKPKKSGITLKFVNENLLFICKLLVIKDRYPDVFRFVKKSATREMLLWPDIRKALEEDPIPDVEESEVTKFRRFNEKVAEWTEPTENSIGWFFSLRRSKEEIALPGWTEFINFATQQSIDDAKKAFSNFKDLGAVDTQLKSYIHGSRDDRARITPFFASMTNIFVELKDEEIVQLKSSMDSLFQSTPVSADLEKILNFVNVDLITGKLQMHLKPVSFNKFTSRLNSAIANATTAGSNIPFEALKNILDALVHHQDKLKKIVGSVRTLIQNKYPTKDTLEYLKSDSDLHATLISTQTLSTYLLQINIGAGGVEALDVLQHYQLGSALNDYINKLVQIVQNTTDVSEQKGLVKTALLTFHNQFEPLEINKESKDAIVTIMQRVAGWYPGLEDEQFDAIRLMLILANINEEVAAVAVSHINNFISRGSLDQVLSILSDPRIEIVKPQIQEEIKVRMATRNNESIELLPYFDLTKLDYVMSHITQKAIDTQVETEFISQLDIAEKIYEKVNEDDLRQMISAHVYRALDSKVNMFTNDVRAFINSKNYKFITNEQRQQIREKIRQISDNKEA